MRKFLVFCILLIYLLFLFPAGIAAGAQNDEIIFIYNVQQFLQIAENPNGHYELANDISLAKENNFRGFENFGGIFNGANFKINDGRVIADTFCLFGNINNARIYDLKIDSFNIYGFETASILADTITNSTISDVEITNCYIEAPDAVLIAFDIEQSTIENVCISCTTKLPLLCLNNNQSFFEGCYIWNEGTIFGFYGANYVKVLDIAAPEEILNLLPDALSAADYNFEDIENSCNKAIELGFKNYNAVLNQIELIKSLLNDDNGGDESGDDDTTSNEPEGDDETEPEQPNTDTEDDGENDNEPEPEGDDETEPEQPNTDTEDDGENDNEPEPKLEDDDEPEPEGDDDENGDTNNGTEEDDNNPTLPNENDAADNIPQSYYRDSNDKNTAMILIICAAFVIVLPFVFFIKKKT